MIVNGTHMAAIEPTERTETNGMRDLWAEVALRVIADERRVMAAAMRGAQRVTLDNGQWPHVIRDVDAEIARARRYFNSPDWREVCSLAGVEVDPDRMIQIICEPRKEP